MSKKTEKSIPKILIVTSYKKNFFRKFIDKKRANYLIKDPKNKKDLRYLKNFSQKKIILLILHQDSFLKNIFI